MVVILLTEEYGPVVVGVFKVGCQLDDLVQIGTHQFVFVHMPHSSGGQLWLCL